MSKPTIVVVDPISTGCYCLDYILKQDEFTVIKLWSPSISPAAKALTIPGLNVTTHFTVEYTTLEETCSKIREIVGTDGILNHVVALSEPGVETADILSFELKVKTSNGIKYSPHRRDKYKQLERLRECKIRTAKQELVSSLDECITFMKELQSTVVIKPVSSAGSDGVFKIPYTPNDNSCYELLEKRFNSIFNKVNKMGIINDQLIIQEFLSGDGDSEFVIDTASYDKVHKLISCWKYSKVGFRDGDFIYLGMELVDSSLPKVKEMFDYVTTVLDALEVSNFAGHSELIYTANGPVLLEIGTRVHGGGGSFIPLQQQCLNGVTVSELFYATLLGTTTNTLIPPPKNEQGEIIYQQPRYFDEFPTLPTNKENTMGYQIDIVNYNPDGILTDYNTESFTIIKNLKSFVKFTELPAIGRWLPQTYDCFTIPASILLLGEPDIVKNDVKVIRELEPTLFISTPGPKP